MRHTTGKKRQLKGNRRAMIADIMINQRKDAVTFRREEAKRLKEFGSQNPPILPSCAVLRKAKEEKLLKQHGLIFSNPILNLLNNANYSKYTGSIISISLLPFFCMYWTPEQQLLYTARCKRDPEAFLTIDATGGIIKRESSQESPIFLYQCVLVSKDGSVPVFQMVSADHRAMMIAFFFRNIIAKGVLAPRTVVTDFGWAILIAASNVFAKCIDFKDYLQKCYAAAVLRNIDMIPACYIRLDVSHLINMVAKWKCLKGKDKVLVRAFYLRCIGQAYQMNSFKELEYFMESLLCVTLSPNTGCTMDKKPLMSDVRMQYLNNIIKDVDINNKIKTDISDDDDENPEVVSFIDDFSNHETNSNATDWIEWSNSVLDAAKKIAEISKNGNIINACYNPEFAKQIRTRLLPYLLVWTGIMRPCFKRSGEIAASSSVEAEFADLKNRGFKGQLPMRIDKFVLQHLEFLNSKIILASDEKDISQTNNTSLELNIHTQNIMFDHYNNPIKLNTTNNLETSKTFKTKEDININKNSESSFENTSTDIIDNVKNLSDVSMKNNDIEYIPDNTDLFDEENLNEFNDRKEKNYIWSICENWHGLTSSTDIVNDYEREPPKSVSKKRTKPSYLDKCPEWEYIKNNK